MAGGRDHLSLSLTIRCALRDFRSPCS